jgi:hypothetical protein
MMSMTQPHLTAIVSQVHHIQATKAAILNIKNKQPQTIQQKKLYRTVSKTMEYLENQMRPRFSFYVC